MSTGCLDSFWWYGFQGEITTIAWNYEPFGTEKKKSFYGDLFSYDLKDCFNCFKEQAIQKKQHELSR